MLPLPLVESLDLRWEAAMTDVMIFLPGMSPRADRLDGSACWLRSQSCCSGQSFTKDV